MGFPDWQEQNTLAQLIAGALSTAGIPVLGSPVPLYNLTSQAAAGPLASVGATVEGAAWNPALSKAAAMTAFNTYVNGNPCNVAQKSFLTEGNLPTVVPAQDQAIISAGAHLYISVKPHRDPGIDDSAKLAATLAAYKATGGVIKPILWSECQPAFSTAAQWQAYWAKYQPVIHAAGLPAVVDFSSGAGVNTIPAYWPAITPDIALQDMYWDSYSNGQDLGNLVQLCSAHNVPIGIGEWNVDSGNRKTPTPTQWQDFINYIITTMQDQIANGFTVDSIMFYMGGESRTLTNNQLLSKTDFKVAGFNQIVAAFSSPPAQPGFTVAAGATFPLPPIAGSPVANYAIANGQSYDLAFNLTADAASSSPWIVAGVNWYNQDARSAWAVHNERWVLPCGKSTGTGTFPIGRGPQNAQYLKVSVTNKDTAPVTGQFQLNSVSRVTTKHDWRWEAPSSNIVPGYTTAGGAAGGLALGGEQGVNVAVGATVSRLLSLFAGEVYFRIVVNGAAGVKTVHATIAPQPVSVWSGTFLCSQYLPLSAANGDNDQSYTVPLPRAPCLLSVTNNDANPVTFSYEVVANEQG